MRATGCVLAVAVALAFAPEAVAQERRGSATKVDKPKTPKKTRRARTPKRRKKKLSGSTSTVEIEVRSQPHGATIIVDGERVGKAPVRVRVSTGRRVVEAVLSGHVTARTTVKAATKMGYMVFSLARQTAKKPTRAAEKRARSKGSGFGTSKLSHKQAMRKARSSLKSGDYSNALRYAGGALSKKPSDPEAKMIATIAACGAGNKSLAKQHLPKHRGSYREIAIRRCDRLGIQLQ